MAKCEFVFETEPTSVFDHGVRPVILRCKTHNCTIVAGGSLTTIENQICLFGQLEAIDARLTALEEKP
jgi:hypothetical protein